MAPSAPVDILDIKQSLTKRGRGPSSMCTDAVPKRSAQTAVVDRRCHDIVEHVQCTRMRHTWVSQRNRPREQPALQGDLLPRAPVDSLLPMQQKAVGLCHIEATSSWV